ncbi:MAG: AAA family ATPase [Planctomycetia bacterium]
MSAPEITYRNPDALIERLHGNFSARGGKITALKANGFDACCPVHGDTNPSLHVSKGDTGIVMNCRTCKAKAPEVMEAVGFLDDNGQPMTVASLFYETTHKAPTSSKPKATHLEPVPDPKPKEKRQTPPTKFGSSVPTADRERLQAAADVIARLDAERAIDLDTITTAGLGLSRDGRIVLPTYNREGEPSPRLWRWPDERTDELKKMHGAGASSPDLYPRPETPAFADGADVYLVEGELDALVGLTHGMQTIGCPGTNMWKPGDAERFARFGSVTIITDADDGGREWATDVGNELREAGVRVIVRDFGDTVPKGYDLTDHALSCRANDVALSMAIEQVPAVIGGRVSGSIVSREPLDLPVPDVGGMFYADAVHMVYGDGGSGKTYMVLAACLTNIREQGGTVVWFDYESGNNRMTQRCELLGFTEADDARFHYYDLTRQSPLMPNRTDVRAYVKAHKPTIVVFDAFAGAFVGAGMTDENTKRHEIEAVLDGIFRPAKADGAASVVLDHKPKGSEAKKGYPIGNERKHSGVDVVIEVDSPTEGVTRMKGWKDQVTGAYNRRGKKIAEYVWSSDSRIVRAVDVADAQTADEPRKPFRPTTLMQRVSEALEAAGAEGLSTRKLEAAVSGNQSGKRAAIAALVREGYVEVEAGAYGATQHRSVRTYRVADDELALDVDR